MRISWKRTAAAWLLCAAAGAASFNLPRSTAEAVVKRWAPPSASAGRALLGEYGLPDDVTPWRVTWNDRGPWTRVAVWNRKPVYRSQGDLSVMEHTIAYPLTSAQAVALMAYSASLTVDLARGELGSRGLTEADDYVNLNLAHEVAAGLKTPAQAAAAGERIRELAAAGKSSPYATGLLFTPARRRVNK